jgi:hypothetical protein
MKVTLLEISVFSAEFPVNLDQNFAGNTFSADFPANTFVGNYFLRFLQFSGNFSAEVSAKKHNKSMANFSAENPQVNPL